jgi:SAM-dependent methyltransferase
LGNTGRLVSSAVDPWEQLGREEHPNWYLDPLAARQKREVHSELIQRWIALYKFETVLKTDLFEEAAGEDQFYFDLFPNVAARFGMDVSVATASRAQRRRPSANLRAVVTDARRMGIASQALDLIISNSTLDHFPSREDFVAAIHELTRTLRHGGVLIITVDNPNNLLYWPLRLLSASRWFPFPLGYTPSAQRLRADLDQAGLEVMRDEWLIHNPRGFSTVLFLVLRRVLGRRADRIIQMLLDTFKRLGAWPTRSRTACFYAALARKR